MFQSPVALLPPIAIYKEGKVDVLMVTRMEVRGEFLFDSLL